MYIMYLAVGGGGWWLVTDGSHVDGLFFMNALEEKFRGKLVRGIASVLKAHEPFMRFCKQSLEKSISLLRPAK